MGLTDTPALTRLTPQATPDKLSLAELEWPRGVAV